MPWEHKSIAVNFRKEPCSYHIHSLVLGMKRALVPNLRKRDRASRFHGCRHRCDLPPFRRINCTTQSSPKANPHNAIVLGSGTGTACTKISGRAEALPDRDVNK